MGVDILQGNKLIEKDADSIAIESLPARGEFFIITGITGGQGFLFGRGNQQITPKFIKRVGKKNILVVASKNKLFALPHQRLLVDTGDKDLDRELAGYHRVQTGKNLSQIVKIDVA